MLVNEGEVDGVRLLSRESVQLLRRDWLNDFTKEKRRHAMELAFPCLGCLARPVFSVEGSVFSCEMNNDQI